MHTKSVPDHDEFPVVKSPVRARVYIAGFIFKPTIDENGEHATELFMVTQVDIAGWVPHLLVNNFSRQVPRQTFTEMERAAQNVHTYVAQPKL